MDGLASGWISIAWTHCWQVTLLIVVVWLILRVAGQNRPHLACALWLVVLLKCVTPPVLSSPSGFFCWLQPVQTREASPLAAQTADGRLAAARRDEAPVVRPLSAATLPSAAPLSAHTLSQSRAAPGWSLPSFSVVLTAAWLLGAALFAVVTATRWWKCWRLLRASVPANAVLLARVGELRQRFGVHRKVRVLVTDSPLGPAVVGLWRPTIVLPAALLADKSLGELEPLLAHELNHIRRGDLWVSLLQAVAGGLWWFHPLVRLAIRLATREAERCCDEEVIARLGCEPAEYARGLLDVLAMKQALVSIPAAPGVRPVDVTSQRLERIMKLGQGCQRRTPWWCWLIVLALAAAVLPGAAFFAGAKERAKPSPQIPKQYISRDFVAEEDPAVELSEHSYDVSDLLESLRQETNGTEESPQVLLLQLVKSAAPGPWAEDKRNAGRWVGVQDGELVVRQSALGHRRINEQLGVLREHGFAELSVEVRIVSGPAAIVEAKGADWRMIGSRETHPTAPGLGIDEPSRDAVNSVVEKHLPALVARVDHQQATELIAAAQADARSNVIQAPKVTLVNGQAARVEDTTQRPFVVGVQPKPQKDGMAFQPVVRVFSEGMTIWLRPVAKKNGRVQLDFALTLSSIRDVDTADFPAGPGKSPITVQVPEVATTRLSTTAELSAEQSLILSLPKTAGSKKETQPLCLVVQVKKLASGLAPAARPATPATLPADDSPRLERASQGPPDLELHGWRFRFAGDDWKLVPASADGKFPRETVIHGNIQLEAVAQKEGGARAERIVAQARSAQILRESSAAGASMTILLEGDVRVIHDQTRLEAAQILLRFARNEDSEGGQEPATLSLEIRNGKSIDLPSKNILEDDIPYSSPGSKRQPVTRD